MACTQTISLPALDQEAAHCTSLRGRCDKPRWRHRTSSSLPSTLKTLDAPSTPGDSDTSHIRASEHRMARRGHHPSRRRQATAWQVRIPWTISRRQAPHRRHRADGYRGGWRLPSHIGRGEPTSVAYANRTPSHAQVRQELPRQPHLPVHQEAGQIARLDHRRRAARRASAS